MHTVVRAARNHPAAAIASGPSFPLVIHSGGCCDCCEFDDAPLAGRSAFLARLAALAAKLSGLLA